MDTYNMQYTLKCLIKEKSPPSSTKQALQSKALNVGHILDMLATFGPEQKITASMLSATAACTHCNLTILTFSSQQYMNEPAAGMQLEIQQVKPGYEPMHSPNTTNKFLVARYTMYIYHNHHTYNIF
jgi:hypothetical protein